MTEPVKHLVADEPEAEDVIEEAVAAANDEAAEAAPNEEDETIPPPWAKLPDWPKNRGFPPGVNIWFVLLETRLMRRKDGGEPIKLKSGKTSACRQLILWELNLQDSKQARQRAAGDSNLYLEELTLQMVRAVDGHPVDWTNERSPHHPRRIWADMGPKYRSFLQRLYSSVHVLNEAEVVNFFENCAEVRKTV